MSIPGSSQLRWGRRHRPALGKKTMKGRGNTPVGGDVLQGLEEISSQHTGLQFLDG